jgi:hypothetical protein
MYDEMKKLPAAWGPNTLFPDANGQELEDVDFTLAINIPSEPMHELLGQLYIWAEFNSSNPQDLSTAGECTLHKSLPRMFQLLSSYCPIH